jgi:hypothetical protein
MRLRVACATGLLGALLLAGAPARAAGIALDQFQPAPAGDVFFGVPSPFARGHLVPRALLFFDYASQPLKLTQAMGRAPVVGRQATLHVDASLTVQDRLLVSVVLPAALVQTGDSPSVGGAMLASPGKAQIGDLRLGARVRMVGDDGEPFQLGVAFDLWAPTAPKGSFAGDSSVRASPQLLLGGQFRAGGLTWVWTAAGGVLIRASTNPSAITYGAGFAASLFDGRVQLGPEFAASTPIQQTTFNVTDTLKIPAQLTTNAELLVGARVRIFRDLTAGWAVGPGLTHAVGTPELRFAGMIGWSPGISKPKASPNADSDGDGIPDRLDACPYAAGPKSESAKKNGCPLIDDDEDGIPNDEDACPNKYGPRSRDPKKNGCPPPPPPAKPPR